MQEFWIKWTYADGSGHGSAPASWFPTESARDTILHNREHWPAGHVPAGTFRTLNGEVE